MKVLVTGGAGYLGSVVAPHLQQIGHNIVVLDSLVHGQHAVAKGLRSNHGIEVMEGDIRNENDRRAALGGIDAVVHLAAVVGDAACREQPEEADTTNVDATLALAADAAAQGIGRFVFASTCSNYGVVEQDSVPVDEQHELNPVSRYAQQKVRVEHALASDSNVPSVTTCLRLSTLFGASPRMRFDLLINEFVRDLGDDRTIDVYGGRTWRPYVHVADAAKAIGLALDRESGFATFNVGSDERNYRKLELAQLVRARVERGAIREITTGDDMRSYRVHFGRIERDLGFHARWSVEEGIDEILQLINAGQVNDPWAAEHVNA